MPMRRDRRWLPSNLSTVQWREMISQMSRPMSGRLFLLHHAEGGSTMTAVIRREC